MGADRGGERVRIDHVVADELRLQHLQIAARQQRAGRRDVARVAVSCTLYSEAPSAVARMHSPAGSSGHGSAPASRRARMAAPRRRPMSPKSRVLAAVHVFADAAREHDAVDTAEIGNRIGKVEVLDRVRQRAGRDRRHQRIRHGLGHLVERIRRGGVAAAPGKPGRRGVVFAGRIEPHDAPGSSTTCRRPPMCTAAVATTLPCSTTASLVVPPPMSMLRMRLPSSCETRAAPEP